MNSCASSPTPNGAPPVRKRHRYNAASVAALDRVAPFRKIDAAQILNVLRLAPNGLTSKEIVAKTGIPLQTVSGRLAELRDAQLIIRTDTRRDHAQVCLAVDRQAVLA